MARWGDERTIQFIHLYRDYECLWKPASPLYKNKTARANAYTKIQKEFSLTEKEIKNKTKSLRSTYHQEKNKVENSKRSGTGSSDIYKPSLIWYKEMGFINESFEYRNSIQTAVRIRVTDDTPDRVHLMDKDLSNLSFEESTPLDKKGSLTSEEMINFADLLDKVNNVIVEKLNSFETKILSEIKPTVTVLAQENSKLRQDLSEANKNADY
ncbi:unnamed protein product [Parnassius apollo]|uniref:(apollo) hypothetical protein n=1 Tax=Parnassius apollo TaxID=110799 RepID=A0A8S3WMA9_PARAO|nr:unnamed protein product [Parnassius apollo]